MINEHIRHFGPFALNVTKRLLLRHAEPVTIGSRAIDLLIALTAHPGRFFENQDLSKAAWPNLTVEDATLRSHIKSLRRVLNDGEDFRYILNSPGRGYSFVAPVNDHRLELDIAFPAFPDVTCGYRTVPPLQRALVGRAGIVNTLAALLDKRRFVSLVAAGGVGKTSVAIAVGHALVPSFGESAVCFIDLSAITDETQLLAAIATAVNCRLEIADGDQELLRYLASRKQLIILDGCEPIAGLVAQIVETIFRRAPGVIVLTTSREALRAEGEYVHHLSPLNCPPDDSASVTALIQSPAVQLFLQKAADIDRDLPLTEDYLSAVAKLCHRLDGIPLAIELAASQTATFGVTRILELLDADQDLPAGSGQSPLPRHKTLNAMFAWSVDLLTEAERRVFWRLSVFAGTFSLEAAARVAGDEGENFQSIANIVLSLVDKSVLSVAIIRQRVNFRLLDTVRAYANGLLAMRGEAQTIATRHATYMIDLISSRDLTGPSEQQSRFATKAYIGNIRKALGWSLQESGNPALGTELAMRASEILCDAGHYPEAMHWSRLAIVALVADDRESLKALRLKMVFVQAALANGSFHADVEAELESALTIAHALNDMPRKASLLLASQVYTLRTGQLDTSLSAAKMLETLSPDIDSTGFGTVVQWSLGGAYHALGRPGQALEHLERGFAAGRDVAEPWADKFGINHQSQARIAMCHSLWLVGAIDEAKHLATRLMQDALNLPSETARCHLILDAGVALLANLGLDGAEAAIRTAIQKATGQSNAYYRTLAGATEGVLSMVRTDYADSIAGLTAAVAAADALGFGYLHHTATFFLSDSLLRAGRYAEALTVTAPRENPPSNPSCALWTPGLLLVRAQAQFALSPQDSRSAEHTVLDALRIAKERGALLFEMRAAYLLSDIWRRDGRDADIIAMADQIDSGSRRNGAPHDIDTARTFLLEGARFGNGLL